MRRKREGLAHPKVLCFKTGLYADIRERVGRQPVPVVRIDMLEMPQSGREIRKDRPLPGREE